MAIPEIQRHADALPRGVTADDELLIVVCRPGGPRSPWIQELRTQAVKALERRHHYLTVHGGFLRPGAAPYALFDWQAEGANGLERRWVAHKAFGALAGTYSCRKIAVWLDRGCGAEELVMAEDLWFRHMPARFDRSNLAGLRLLSAEPEVLHSADPHRTARLEGHLQVRQWVNENPDELTSLVIGERLAAFCKEHDCGFESMLPDRLAALGMNLLLAVGQAGERSPPRLHLATHNLGRPGRPLLLVGKGITFDSGGINLKPHESFVNCMKNDMGGAALTSQLFMALVRSGYPGPLVLAVPSCENAIDARSMKPGSIIRSHAGLDVIIEHTDAEGRLILADALHYAQKRWEPGLTVMAATLTTASLRQFTNFFTPVHFAPAGVRTALAAAAAEVGEAYTFWDEFLPFAQGNRTNAADLTNMGRMPSHANIGGGSNVAAHFLREFAVRPLVHVDIFASTWNWSGDYPGAHYGATGAPFNSLFRALSADAGRGFGLAG